MTLRDARPEDADAIADVYLVSRRDALPFLRSVHSDADVRRWIAHRLLREDRVTVAEEDGRIVGFVATKPGWLDQLYVHPDAQGRGIGRALFAAAAARLERPFSLYCFQANRRARLFYRAAGMAEAEYGDGSQNEEGEPDVRFTMRR